MVQYGSSHIINFLFQACVLEETLALGWSGFSWPNIYQDLVLNKRLTVLLRSLEIAPKDIKSCS